MLNYSMLNPADFDYPLPSELIANHPCSRRDNCRLLIVDRRTHQLSHYKFSDLVDYLGPNDVLILNQSKVFPARVFGKKITGGKVELLLLNSLNDFVWESMFKPGQKSGTMLYFGQSLIGKVVDGSHISFNFPKDKVYQILEQIGFTPTPPYIKNLASEKVVRQQYQTVYAKSVGSAAAPTAGLHFTKNLLKKLINQGVQVEYVTLHVGLGTFQPLRPENLKNKTLHNEIYEISPEVADRLNQAKVAGKRIICVGTTSVRTLESAADDRGILTNLSGSTNIFIYPGVKLKFVNSLITNFHLPQSSLLMLVSTIASWPLIQKAYLEAISQKYRFFSFGDAMWLV